MVDHRQPTYWRTSTMFIYVYYLVEIDRTRSIMSSARVDSRGVTLGWWTIIWTRLLPKRACKNLDCDIFQSIWGGPHDISVSSWPWTSTSAHTHKALGLEEVINRLLLFLLGCYLPKYIIISLSNTWSYYSWYLRAHHVIFVLSSYAFVLQVADRE